jgi:hypothetical protein
MGSVMPGLSKGYPISIEAWTESSPKDFEMWIDHIANEYLWSTNDAAYSFLTSLGAILKDQKWQYKKPEEAQKEATMNDDVVIDVRKFAVQKASEILSFDVIDFGDEAKELVKAAKKIEKYILGTD